MTDLSPQAAAILDVVREHRTGTSFVEIENAYSGTGCDPDGDLGMEHPAVPNLFMWAGVNAAFLDALNELLGAKLVHYRPTSVLVYLADGKMLSLPIAKKPPRNGYREPHWVPVVINLGPAPTT